MNLSEGGESIVAMDDLKLLDVVVGEVGEPSNDGTPGSGLYEVPIRMSRRPTDREAQLLSATWDQPPQWTSMHRPGILAVVGDQLVLRQTTISEVKQYHAATLKLVVSSVNGAGAAASSRRCSPNGAAENRVERAPRQCRADRKRHQFRLRRCRRRSHNP